MKQSHHHHHHHHYHHYHQNRVILDMLVDRDWRHLILTEGAAKRLLERTPHRGYLITPLHKPQQDH